MLFSGLHAEILTIRARVGFERHKLHDFTRACFDFEQFMVSDKRSGLELFIEKQGTMAREADFNGLAIGGQHVEEVF